MKIFGWIIVIAAYGAIWTAVQPLQDKFMGTIIASFFFFAVTAVLG